MGTLYLREVWLVCFSYRVETISVNYVGVSCTTTMWQGKCTFKSFCNKETEKKKMTTNLISLSNNSNRFVVILLKTDEKKMRRELFLLRRKLWIPSLSILANQTQHTFSLKIKTTIQFCRWFCLLITAATSKDTTRTEKKTFFGKQGP